MYFIHINSLPANMSMHYMHAWCVTSGELPRGYWELTLISLLEQEMFLTTEPTLQSQC